MPVQIFLSTEGRMVWEISSFYTNMIENFLHKVGIGSIVSWKTVERGG